MPFDRLIRAVDTWAGDHREHVVKAQIGNSRFVPQFMEYSKTLKPSEFDAQMATASIVVAHAGMGTIISATEFGKPMILLPRRGNLKETRNDHQISTAKWLATKPGMTVAYDESELAILLTREVTRVSEASKPSVASADMIQALREVVGRL